MASHQPNTLLISPYFDAGLPSGGVLYSIDIAREWLARGRQLHVICLNRPRTLADLEPYVAAGQLVLHPIARDECARFTHHPDDSLLNATHEILSLVRPDLVHIHNIQGMLSAVAAAIEFGTPTILTALDFGMLCFNFCLYTQSPRICRTPLSTPHCTACIAQSIPGPARTAGRLLPRWATRRIWPRFVRMDQMKSVHELHGIMRHVLQSLSKIVAPSPGLADALMANGAARNRVIHLLYGISPEKIVRPAKQISELLRMGYVGGVDPIKGFATIADALDLLPSGLPLTVRAFGGDSLRKYVAGRSAKVQSYIDYHPALFGRPLMQEHARLDAMLVPSIVHENTPFAALESFANGTPVLGSNHPGISHLIVPDRNGWLIEPGMATAWARAFIRAVQQPARIRAMQLTAKFTRTTQDFVNDLEWVENPLIGRATRREEFRPTPPVAVYA